MPLDKVDDILQVGNTFNNTDDFALLPQPWFQYEDGQFD